MFDDEVWEECILSNHDLESFPVTNAFGKVFNAYRYIGQNGEKILIAYPPMGAPASVSEVELIIASGIKKIVAFGTCKILELLNN